ncbi:MAG: MATE family efflux transporter, partial [Pseudomonadota bacterium]
MPKKATQDLSDPRLLLLVIRLGVPAILGLSANAINQFIDALWITRLSPAAMASIGVTFPLIIVATAATAGIGVAIAGEIGRRLGRKDKVGAEGVALTAFVTALSIATMVGYCLLLTADESLPVVGASAETLSMAKIYLTILLCALPIATFQIVSDFVALGSGNSRRSMQTLMACFGLNIILDPIFIFGFGWGVAGAAMATIAGQILACTIYMIWFRRGTLGLHPMRGELKRENILNLLRFAPPITMVNLLTAVSFLILVGAIARLADDVYVAALTFDLRLASLIIIPIQGLALGAQAAVSHAHGAGDPIRAHRLIHCILGLSTILGLTLTVTILLAASFLFPIMIPMAGMQHAAVGMFPYFAAFIIGSCAYIPLLSGFQATDRALFAAIVALAPNGYVMLPLIILFPLFWGISGLLWAVALSGAITCSTPAISAVIAPDSATA